MKISVKDAKKIAIKAQLLMENGVYPTGKEGVLHIIKKLGYIQIDTISVIERAHHHTFWSRCPDYSHKFLHELQATDKTIFEYWGHAASYLPISDYRYTLPMKKKYHDPKSKWVKNRFEKYGHLFDSILERIKKEGPLASKDFKPIEDRKGTGWWDWKPAKVALELLFWRGDLMIAKREKFQRIYDLTERVLPQTVDTTFPDDQEVAQFCINRALNAHGIASTKDIQDHLSFSSKKEITTQLAHMVKSGQVTPITIESLEKSKYYALPKTLESFENTPSKEKSVHILSPFDNLIILRNRIKQLFNFNFALECYLPANKRKYGYFSLPILWGDEFVGRMDCKADRKRKILIIRNLVFEGEFEDFSKFIDPFYAKLRLFADFNGCQQIEIENINQPKFKDALNLQNK